MQVVGTELTTPWFETMCLSYCAIHGLTRLLPLGGGGILGFNGFKIKRKRIMGVNFHLIVGCTQNYGHEFREKNKDKRNVVILDHQEEKEWQIIHSDVWYETFI